MLYKKYLMQFQTVKEMHRKCYGYLQSELRTKAASEKAGAPHNKTSLSAPPNQGERIFWLIATVHQGSTHQAVHTF